MKVNEYNDSLICLQACQQRRCIEVSAINSQRASDDNPVSALWISARNLKKATDKAYLFYLSESLGTNLCSPWFSHFYWSDILKQKYVLKLIVDSNFLIWASQSTCITYGNLAIQGYTKKWKGNPFYKRSPWLENLRLHCELCSCRFPRFAA